MTTTVSLPTWLPYVNFGLSVGIVIAAILLVILVIRQGDSSAQVKVLRMSVVLGALGLLTSGVVLVAGALNQAGILATEPWIVIGTGGRGVVLIIVLVLAITVNEERDQ